MTFENGERAGNLLPNRESVGEVSGRSPDQRIKGDEIPLQGHSIRDRARSVLYIHQVALLPLNLRTVSPIYGETSKCALLLFLVFINSDLKAS